MFEFPLSTESSRAFGRRVLYDARRGRRPSPARSFRVGVRLHPSHVRCPALPSFALFLYRPSVPCSSTASPCSALSSLLFAGAGAGGKKEEQPGAASGEFTVDYPLYQSFWRLQKYTLEQEKAVKGEGAKETWEALLADVDKVSE